ncbi:MAG: spore cortex biosynthesis protein YabQ [Clostridia bacterium]|nr:spore cortex biosynthesis protein YabQ [Clostridia bacterium]
MDTKNQFTVFCVCVVAGFLFGIVYEIFAFFRMLFGCPRGKNKGLGLALDIALFGALALYYVAVAYAFRFPDFRAYTWLGLGVGGIIYSKTLHRIVAFLGNKCYNKITEIAKKLRDRRKNSKKKVEREI